MCTAVRERLRRHPSIVCGGRASPRSRRVLAFSTAPLGGVEQRDSRRCRRPEHAVAIDDIGFRGLEHSARRPAALLDHRFDRAHDGAADGHGRARGNARRHRRRRRGRVSPWRMPHLFGAMPSRSATSRREHGAMALPGRMHGGDELQGAVRRESRRATPSLGSAARMLEETGDAEPRSLPRRFASALRAPRNPAIVGKLARRLLEHRRELAAVDRWCRPRSDMALLLAAIRFRRRSRRRSMPLTRAASSTTRSIT